MARYFRRTDGQTRWYFLTAIANTAAPTTAEVNAGVALNTRISEVSGFTYKNEPITTPDLSTSFVSTIGGEDVADDCSLIFYDDDTSMSLWNALAKGTTGYMVINPYARVASTKCRVWTVVSLGPNDEYTVDASAARFMVDFSVAVRPNLDSTFPASVTI
jgi:hypothetical protein